MVKKVKVNDSSKKFKLNKEDMIKIAKGAGIAIASSALIYIAEIVPYIDFGQFNLVVAALVAIGINAARKLLAE